MPGIYKSIRAVVLRNHYPLVYKWLLAAPLGITTCPACGGCAGVRRVRADVWRVACVRACGVSAGVCSHVHSYTCIGRIVRACISFVQLYMARVVYASVWFAN